MKVDSQFVLCRWGIVLSLGWSAVLALAQSVPTSSGAPKTAEQLILEDPVREYAKFRLRLKKNGPNASFPEFKPVVDRLKEKINSAEVLAIISAHPDLQFELNEVNILLTHVNLEFKVDDPANYPYDIPFSLPFPYRPTIDAIEAALRLLDKVERLTNPKAVPLYHFDRYAYHRHSLLADGDIVIFPTLSNLTFQNLIRVRGVPIGFVGVITETIRVDRHWQSPLDFWYHDLNHVRRMMAYLALRAKARGVTSGRAKLAFYREMDQFIQEVLMPNIKALPKGSSPEDIAVRRLVRVILFEIVHETALTAEKEVIVADLLRAPNTPQPFEFMMPRLTIPAEEIERLRTASGNLESGVAARSRDARVGENPAIVIRYFHDRALSLLANVYNKINYGFFDDVDDPSEFVAPVEFRKAKYLVKAAQTVLGFLGSKEVPDERTLTDMVLSMKGSEEKFAYKRLNDHEGLEASEQGPKTTEPITAAEIVSQIRAIGKKVYTLYGYSKLDYEKKREVLARIRKELEGLDRSQWVINIGATEEGIGAAYQVAKEMGFETIGIVSTRALVTSGRFSKYVDRIFIVNDNIWGGYIPGTTTLAPATEVFVLASDVISAHGGGAGTAVALRASRARGIPTYFTPAEMNHAIAKKDALERGKSAPTDFRGPAFHEWEKLIGESRSSCEIRLSPST